MAEADGLAAGGSSALAKKLPPPLSRQAATSEKTSVIGWLPSSLAGPDVAKLRRRRERAQSGGGSPASELQFPQDHLQQFLECAGLA